MANSEDPDETAPDEPSHLGLHCLHRYLSLGSRAKRVNHTSSNYLTHQLVQNFRQVPCGVQGPGVQSFLRVEVYFNLHVRSEHLGYETFNFIIV